MKRVVRNPAYLKAFGEHFRKMRKAKGKTMMDIANETEIAYTQVSKIESGQINTTISTVVVLAEALKVEPAELFQFNYSPKPEKK